MRTKAARSLRAALIGLVALACAGAGAHEFWILPQSFRVPVGGGVVLSMAVGESFQGEPMAFSAQLVSRLRRIDRSSETDLRQLVPAAGSADTLRLDLPRAGTHIIALDTHPSLTVLEAEKFNDYLQEDGLVSVQRAREAAGTTATPGRERFRRNIKTIVDAGGDSDDTYQRRTGQKLELVPLQHPAKLRLYQPLTLQVWFDDRPLAGALVRLWHGNGPGATLVSLTAVSDAKGQVTLPMARLGTWMASVVHMVPAAAGCDCDWDSYWGNLTFALPAGRSVQPGTSSSRAPRR